MSPRPVIHSAGLIIIGNEILDGRRTDRHFVFVRDLLKERNLRLRYALMLADEPALLEQHLRWAMAQPEPFFCCGGIGSTPDDYTRDAAAAAAGVAVEYHAEGLEILRRRFGESVHPGRIKMVLFPAGAALIPNPVNQVPGFSIRNGHFVPGFPEMAAPMIRWVLDSLYEAAGPRVARAVTLPGAREGDLVELMEAFLSAHPGLSFSSLPRFVPGGGTEVQLGLTGAPEGVDAGMRDLMRRLSEAGHPFRESDPARE